MLNNELEKPDYSILDMKKSIRTLILLSVVLIFIILVLGSFLLKGELNPKALVLDIIPDILAYLVVSITVLIFYMFVLKDRLSDNRIEDVLEILKRIEKPDIKYEHSGKEVYDLIFRHYLESENNCLDYIALASNEKVIARALNNDLSTRMKGNNNRDSSSKEKLREWEKFLHDSNKEIKNIAKSLSNIEQGSLHKIIFDVKIGGIIYEIFNDPEDEEIYYLFGATVDQNSIDNGIAYKELETIFEEVKNKVAEEFNVNIVNHKS